jgi:hypothetical protein
LPFPLSLPVILSLTFLLTSEGGRETGKGRKGDREGRKGRRMGRVTETGEPEEEKSE